MDNLPIPTIKNVIYLSDEDAWSHMDITAVLNDGDEYVLLKDTYYMWQNNRLASLDIDQAPEGVRRYFFEVAKKYLTRFHGHCNCGTCENMAEAELCLASPPLGRRR